MSLPYLYLGLADLFDMYILFIMSYKLIVFIVLSGLLACQVEEKPTAVTDADTPTTPYLLVLGIAQDAGFPQADCRKECCREAWTDPQQRRMVSCLAVVDPASNRSWLLDATPDFKYQLKRLQDQSSTELAGIFLTHAHIGHYTGLMHLGREAMGAESVPVYAMPRMRSFLQENGPWSQLVRLNNINLPDWRQDSLLQLSDQLRIRAFQVPHRDEFSETVGFQIDGPNHSAVFIPDIDKWEKWDRPIDSLINRVDYAFLDGSFYQNGEIPGRDMSEIPHPFIIESIKLFQQQEVPAERVFFIHFNHTNPVLRADSPERHAVEATGFGVAAEGQVVTL